MTNTTLDCARAEELFSDHLEGALDKAVGDALEVHLSGCARCRELLDALGSVLDVLHAEESIEPAADLARRVADAALRARRAPAWRRLVPPGWSPQVRIYALAAGLALVSTGAVFLARAVSSEGAPARLVAKAASTGAYIAERKDRLVEDLRALRVVVATAFEGRVDRMNGRVDDYRRLLERRREPQKKPEPQSLSSRNSNPEAAASVRLNEGRESQSLRAHA